MTEIPQTCCTSEIGQLMAEGVEKVVGRSAAQAVDSLVENLLRQHSQEGLNRPFAELTAIQAALEEKFGGSGGRGIALRAGQTAFSRLMHRHEVALGWDQMIFRLQPTPQRLTGGLKSLAALLGQLIGTEIAIEKDEYGWRLNPSQCPFCYHRKADESVCHFMLGLVQEYFAWASSGKVYLVSEVECFATGGEACLLFIHKAPLS